MKIEFEIPDWAIGRNITIFAGKELLAQTNFIIEKRKGVKNKFYAPLQIKPENGRCNGCGTCCETKGSPFSQQQFADLLWRLDNYDFSHTGKCPILGENGCSLGTNIPFDCARSVCTGMDNCTEKLIELEEF